MSRAWTGPEGETLRRIYQKFDVPGCALILDRSHISVQDKVTELKLKSPRVTFGNSRIFYAEDIANIFELMAGGFNPRQISKCFRVPSRTIQTVVARAKREGFDAYPRR